MEYFKWKTSLVNIDKSNTTIYIDILSGCKNIDSHLH